MKAEQPTCDCPGCDRPAKWKMLGERRAFTAVVRVSYEPDLKRWWKWRLTIERGVSGWTRPSSVGQHGQGTVRHRPERWHDHRVGDGNNITNQRRYPG